MADTYVCRCKAVGPGILVNPTVTSESRREIRGQLVWLTHLSNCSELEGGGEAQIFAINKDSSDRLTAANLTKANLMYCLCCTIALWSPDVNLGYDFFSFSGLSSIGFPSSSGRKKKEKKRSQGCLHLSEINREYTQHRDLNVHSLSFLIF